MPLINSTVSVHQITILEKASLTVSGILKLSSTILSADTSIDLRNGSLVMLGETPQTIDGNYFKESIIRELIISNNKTISIVNPI
ncbi:hypothetical protein, partial [Pseudomonas aeruginosa]|uniref:hypothetical protein n=1 Tax=Pseudomonas aeruginosa TaxID=287 RepID=UPI002B403AF8